MSLIFYMYHPQHAASRFLSLLSWLAENLTLQRNHIAEECNTLISGSNI